MRSFFQAIGLTLASAILALTLAACGDSPSAQQKVTAQLGKVYALNDVERPLANANAKQFFERPWVTADNKLGQFIACRPSDSNANGLVTCTGFIPLPQGGYTEVTRYCGYRPELVGCSDQDTVKP